MHVKQYINQGHSVTTPADLGKGIESNEGICGVRVTVVPVPKTTMYLKSIKWEGISTLFNFEITTAGVRAFKAYGIGAGNFRSWTSFVGKHAIIQLKRFYSMCTLLICSQIK